MHLLVNIAAFSVLNIAGLFHVQLDITFVHMQASFVHMQGEFVHVQRVDMLLLSLRHVGQSYGEFCMSVSNAPAVSASALTEHEPLTEPFNSP